MFLVNVTYRSSAGNHHSNNSCDFRTTCAASTECDKCTGIGRKHEALGVQGSNRAVKCYTKHNLKRKKILNK